MRTVLGWGGYFAQTLGGRILGEKSRGPAGLIHNKILVLKFNIFQLQRPGDPRKIQGKVFGKQQAARRSTSFVEGWTVPWGLRLEKKATRNHEGGYQVMLIRPKTGSEKAA